MLPNSSIKQLMPVLAERMICLRVSMARSLAVKTGTYLTEKEQENLINGLFACKDPNVSPFQKPTFITIRVEDLDKKFTL